MKADSNTYPEIFTYIRDDWEEPVQGWYGYDTDYDLYATPEDLQKGVTGIRNIDLYACRSPHRDCGGIHYAKKLSSLD